MKILFLDVETRPILATTWTLWEPKLGYENIVEDWGLLTAAWKWGGEAKVHSAQIDPRKPKDDRPVVVAIHKAIQEADVVVGHNGDEFDLKKINARAVFHKLPPAPPVATIDTLKIARKYFGFTANRLDYLGQYLGVGRKKPTGGFGLWLKVLAGDRKALRKMVEYNKGDVVLLEEIYKIFRPYIRNHPNENLHSDVKCCPNCGAKKFTRSGVRHTKTRSYARYVCSSCHAWFSGETVAAVKLK